MKKQWLITIGVLFIIVAVFFYPMWRGNIPFPGDTLVGNYFPYNSLSYFGYAPGAVPNKAQGPDVIRELLPWKKFVVDSWKVGQVPLWNPYNFSGNPIMANFQSAVFYPLTAIFLLLPFNLSWTIFIFLIPLLSAFFLYLYLREIDLSPISSIFGGIVFAFSSYMVVWMEYGNIGHTLLWLPLGLYLLEKLLKRFSLEKVLSLILVLFVAILGGYIQGYFYIVGTLLFYFVGRVWQGKRLSLRHSILVVTAFVLPILLSLFQFLPTLQLFSQSSRSNYSLETIDKLLNPWWYSITVLVPDFFGNPASRNYWFYGTYIERVSFFGVIPLLFALFALWQWKKQKVVRIFGLLFGLTFFLAFNLFITKYFYLIPIPVISTTVPTRILCLFVLSGAILSAIGLDTFLSRERQKNFLYATLIPLVLFVCGWGMVILNRFVFHDVTAQANSTVSLRNMLLPTAIFFVGVLGALVYWRNKRFKTIFIVLVLGLTFFDLFRFFHKITPFSPEAFLYPQTPITVHLQRVLGINRVWGYGSAAIDTNFQLFDHTYSTDGNDPLHVRSYTEFLESSKNGALPQSLPRPDANWAPGYGPDDLRRNMARQKVLNLLGVKYIVHKYDEAARTRLPDTQTFDSKVYRLDWGVGPYQIYENLSVLPRTFLTNHYEVITDRRAFFARFYSQSFNPRQTLILETDPHIQSTTNYVGNTSVLLYSPQRVVIKTQGNSDALLFMSDTMYPGWKARIDGVKSTIYTADYAFRAVKVTKGTHVVEYYFEDDRFRLGLMISLITVGGIIAGYLYLKHQKV